MRKDFQDLRNKTVEGLVKTAGELRLSMAKAELEMAARRSKNTNIVSNQKRDLARILTLIREKELTSS